MKSSAEPANRGIPGRLGRYEVIGRLATGGMAEIFLGRVLGPRGFERPVAIKRILPHLAADRTFLDMFIAEAKIAAAIRHARVAQVHELADCDDGYLLVMEYVEGESMGGLMRRMWLRGESLDRALAAYLVAEACSGLHAVHELTDAHGASLGVVHRDVSPQNVMVTYAGEVKILDFGIAKAHDSDRTKTGHVKGKCEYMSPEQCRGESLDRQSDLFSLGIVLYELSVRKRLFKRDSALHAFDAICHAPIPRPTEVDPAYPEVLEPICARALARDRLERYANALEMRRDLVAAIRKMGGADGGAGEEERLAVLMARLFADRIEEKREMLRHAPQAAIGRLPAAEVDAHVELPAVPRETRVELRVEAAPSVHSTSPVKRRPLVIAAAAAALAIAGGLWLADGGRAPVAAMVAQPGATTTTATATPEPEAAREAAAAVTPGPATTPGSATSAVVAPPATVSLVVETTPPGAEVSIDGAARGRTPCSIEVARAEDAVTVAVVRSGFTPINERVVPDIDQKLILRLHPAAAISRPTKPRSARANPPQPPKPAPVFERFD